MRVRVTPVNIDAYDLVTVTGNTREDLLARAAEALVEGHGDFYVIIPDVLGGDTEIPTERNVFEHYDGLPEPDGYTHEQASIDLARACSYKLEFTSDGKSFYICQKHNTLSKHAVDATSHTPCLAIDPYEEPV